MNEKEVLELLSNSGQDIDTPENIDGYIIHSTPHYMGNYGYFHIKHGECEAIVLKSVYQDFIRILKGPLGMPEDNLQPLIKTLNDSEVATKSMLDMVIRIESGSTHIKTATIHTKPARDRQDVRLYMLPRPLTNAEYQIPSSKLYNENVILSSGYLGEFMPPVMSYFTDSIMEKLVNLLNPIFESCNLRTSTPSIVPMHGRVYINMTELEKILATIELGKSIFRASHSPHLYIKDNGKIGNLNKRYFPVELDEITELLDSLAKSVNAVSHDNITHENYLDYPVQLMIVFEYLTLKLSDKLGRLLKYFPDIQSTLSAVYKTRDKSIFSTGEEYTMPHFFDVASDISNVTYEKLEREKDNIASHISKLPFGKKFGKVGKIEKIIKDIHALLDIRDEVFKATWTFTIKSNAALKKISDIAINRKKLYNENDIFFFDHDEVKRIHYDTYYSDTVSAVTSRQARIYRYKAQVTVPELYGYDLEKLPQISEQMISKSLETIEHDVLVLNKIDTTGMATSDLSLGDYTDMFIVAEKLSIAELDKFKSAKGFILENVSPFSPVTEYAVLNNIALYTGIRFAGITLNDKKIETINNKILIKGD